MAHIHELYDFTSSAYIVHKNNILLIHHKKIGTWLAPGGHVELDEEPLQALWREIKEETGLDKGSLELITSHAQPLPDKHPGFYPIPTPFAMFVVEYASGSTHQHIDLCYLLKSSSDKVVHQAEEAHDIGWFSQAACDAMLRSGDMFPHTHAYASWALQQRS